MKAGKIGEETEQHEDHETDKKAVDVDNLDDIDDDDDDDGDGRGPSRGPDGLFLPGCSSKVLVNFRYNLFNYLNKE